VIAAGVRLGGGTQALKSIREPGDYMGYPHVDKRLFVRIAKAAQDLPKMRAEWADRREKES
jgi:hypothetical protein